MNPFEWGIDAAVEGYLYNICETLGWHDSNGWGPIPLPWSEIRAYSKCMRELNEPWEFEAIRRMSVAYCAGLSSKEHLDPALWKRYQGLIKPLVTPSDPGVARVAAVALEI